MLKIAWLFVDTYISVIFAVSDLTVISALKTSSWPTISNAIEHSEIKNVPFRCKWLLQCVINKCRVAKRSWHDSCMSSASLTQRTTIVNNSFRASHSVYNSWRHPGAAKGRSMLGLQQLWTYASLCIFALTYFVGCRSRASNGNGFYKRI